MTTTTITEIENELDIIADSARFQAFCRTTYITLNKVDLLAACAERGIEVKKSAKKAVILAALMADVEAIMEGYDEQATALQAAAKSTHKVVNPVVIEIKSNGYTVYTVESSNGKDKYTTTIAPDGHATGCSCPCYTKGHKECYHMEQLSGIEQFLRRALSAPREEVASVVVEAEQVVEAAQRRRMCDRCCKYNDEYRVQSGEVLCEKCIAELEANANPTRKHENAQVEPEAQLSGLDAFWQALSIWAFGVHLEKEDIWTSLPDATYYDAFHSARHAYFGWQDAHPEMVDDLRRAIDGPFAPVSIQCRKEKRARSCVNCGSLTADYRCYSCSK